MTSLIVASWARAIAFTRSSGNSTEAKLRSPLMATLSGVRGADGRPLRETVASASRADCTAAPRPPGRLRASSTAARGILRSSSTWCIAPAISNSRAVTCSGAGPGAARRRRGRGSASTNDRRNTCAEAPSRPAWCVLMYRATWPPASPSMTCSSHSGRSRSMSGACRSATHSSSWCWLPGSGNTVRRTW